ncbi:MAG: lamin tail domain-containing protein [Prolixibacteraceae bacterium]
MALKNYIFIFFVVAFGSIESWSAIFDLNAGTLEHPVMKPANISLKHFADKTAGSVVNSNYFDVSQLVAGEIVINEIMADPTPVKGLPDREYLELYNGGPTAVNLKGWSLGLGTKLKIFPEVTVVPGGYLLVTATGGTKDLQQYGKGIEISGFLVNNDGLTISMYDPDKRLIDQVDYLPSLHKKGFEDGGYSLERIDPERLCGQRSNWVTTLSAKGGTPGAENSVRASNPDHMPPQILSSTFADNCRLEVRFSEFFLLSGIPEEALKNLPAGVVVDSVRTDKDANLLKICFKPSTILSGLDYSLTLHGLKDECSNTMSDMVLKFGYYLPVKSDLLINEVLFNPYPEGSDFVEIYNNSRYKVDLSGLYLATRDEIGALKQVEPLSSGQQYLAAGSYLAVTKSIEGVLRFYPSKWADCILQTEKFPTLADLSGSVVLLNADLEVLDEMEYNEGMHHPLITEKEGISLERISFSVPASRKENWHSAAKSAGFATPGYQNSAVGKADSTKNWVSIDPVIFSPNGDGIHDNLNIYINTGETGWILNITILNCTGRVIRKLANNVSAGSADQLVWDGLGGDNQKVQPGIYILDISLFAISGKTRRMRYACVITDHL